MRPEEANVWGIASVPLPAGHWEFPDAGVQIREGQVLSSGSESEYKSLEVIFPQLTCCR